ncbi:MAG: YgfZ/GcvT domain-containing protein [Albidovulum sp.]
MPTPGEAAADRKVHEITGEDRETFLQGLVTNDIRRLSQGLVYAAMLSPQGKYLADFLLVPAGDRILLDVHESVSEELVRRLAMYRLRADVRIAPSSLQVSRGLGPAPAGAFADPRHPALGWRLYAAEPGGATSIDWDRIRVDHCIPETGIELIPEETYILEAGFERLHGVDFRKGCYVGQEVTARMKHKTELRKGLVTVAVDGAAPVGSEILAGGKPAGRIFTQSGGRGIAWLRFDRAEEAMQAGDARITMP